MRYRIELKRIDRTLNFTDYNECAFSSTEVKAFLSECVPEGYKVARIIKTTQDGHSYDVTDKYFVAKKLKEKRF